MRKYYYSTGVDRKGPVTLEELKSSGELTPETLIWYEGLPTWIRAADLPELSDIFVNAAAPPVGSVTSAPEATLQRLERSMFLQVFSFTGRIRRLEYILSVMIAVSAFWLMLLIFQFVAGLNYLLSDQSLLHSGMESSPVLWIISLILIIFLFAQGAKRSHDIGLSGWWQLMPLYDIVLIFFAGTKGPNRDGPDPRLLLSSPPPLPLAVPSSSSPPLPNEIVSSHLEGCERPDFRLEAIRCLKSAGKSFDEYELNLKIEDLRAEYLKSEGSRRETKRSFLGAKEEAEQESSSLKLREDEANRRQRVFVIVFVIVCVLLALITARIFQ